VKKPPPKDWKQQTPEEIDREFERGKKDAERHAKNPPSPYTQGGR
jgi:hypothetical protein